jgi:hypothetical protein
MYKCLNADDEIVEVDDDEPVPVGHKLVVPLSFLDATAREVIEGLRERYGHVTADEDGNVTEDGDEEGDDGEEGDGDTDDSDQLTPAARAYLHAKNALDYRNKRKKVAGSVRAPAPTTPSWQRSPWKPRKGAIEMGGAPDSADGEDAEAAAEAARKAYLARSKALSDAWRRKSGHTRKGGPWLSADASRSKPSISPSWASGSGGSPPGVGPSGTRSPYRDQRLSDGQAAYLRMVDDLSNRWKKNRRAFVPGEVA